MPSLAKTPRKRHGLHYWVYRFRWYEAPASISLGYLTAAEAKRLFGELNAVLYAGTDPRTAIVRAPTPEPGAATLTTLLSSDEKYRAGRVQPRTIEMARDSVNRTIELVGDLPLHELNVSKASEIFSDLHIRRGWKPNTSNLHLRNLRSLFERAAKVHHLVESNPFADVEPLAVEVSDRPRHLTHRQVELLLNAISEGDPFSLLVRFYLLTGCRRNEALDITWTDVELAAGNLYLGKSGSQTKKRRPFPISANLAQLLQSLSALRSSNTERMFHFYASAPTVNHRFRSLSKVTDIPDDLSPHMLRHTFASHLVMAGSDLTTVAKLMGHTTSKVTELYSHLTDTHLAKTAARLNW